MCTGVQRVVEMPDFRIHLQAIGPEPLIRSMSTPTAMAITLLFGLPKVCVITLVTRILV